MRSPNDSVLLPSPVLHHNPLQIQPASKPPLSNQVHIIHLVGVHAHGGHAPHAKVKGRHAVAQLPRKGQHKAAQAAVDVQRHSPLPRDLLEEGAAGGTSGGCTETCLNPAGPNAWRA